MDVGSSGFNRAEGFGRFFSSDSRRVLVASAFLVTGTKIVTASALHKVVGDSLGQQPMLLLGGLPAGPPKIELEGIPRDGNPMLLRGLP